MKPPPELAFDQVVFSGGGTRCFYFGGFVDVVAPAIGLAPERVAGVSGGALTAAAFIANRAETLFNRMAHAFDGIDRNVRLNKIDEAEGITPHQRTYREVVSEAMDAEAVERVANGPAFNVLLSHPPSNRFPRASTYPAMLAYQCELLVRSNPEMEWPARLGMRQTLVDGRQAARDGRLVDLICAAAVIPPVFEVDVWDGEQVVDGGMSCKAPIPVDGAHRTLVLLTRHFRNLPKHDGRRHYVMPSRETPADKIDFTSREKIERTWNLGLRDGRAFLRSHGVAVPDEPNEQSSRQGGEAEWHARHS